MSAFRAMKNVVLSLGGLAVIWFFTVSLPYWIASSHFDPFPLRLGSLRFIGWVAIVVGAGVILWCYGIFIFIGKGTPWPFDPPKRLVIAGPYRHVRNPMEASCLVVIFGEMLLYASSGLIPYMLISFLVLHLRQVAIEEPGLRSRFGAAYEEYRSSVPRWYPRMTPYRRKD
jgi:protein-S-isoprenylcysteine O-methyltransferase Ste14